MQNNNDCPKSIIKIILNFLSKEDFIAKALFGSLAVGFVVVAFSVGYATILQAKIGCLSVFGLFK